MNIQPTAFACSFSRLSGRNLHGMRFTSGAGNLLLKKLPNENGILKDFVSEIRKKAAEQTKQFIDYCDSRVLMPTIKNVEPNQSKASKRFELVA